MAKDLRATRDYMRDKRAGTLDGRKWSDYKGGGSSAYDSISNAKSMSEAAGVAEKHGISVAITDNEFADEVLLQKLVAEIGWVKDEFPSVGHIDVISDRDYKGAYAYASTDSDAIAMAGNYSTFDKVQDRGLTYFLNAGIKDKNGHTEHPNGSKFEHIGTHEAAHKVVMALINNVMNKAFGTNYKNYWAQDRVLYDEFCNIIVDTAFAVAKKENPQKGLRLAGYKKQISKYAYTGGDGEAIAEGLADYRANGGKSRSLSKAIYQTLKDVTSAEGTQMLVDHVKENYSYAFGTRGLVGTNKRRS